MSESKKTSLVIMAAGIGSRFGQGIKQLEKMGPNGQIIMDYSIHDALEAGFNKIIFVIRKDLEADFREVIGTRIEAKAQVEYAFQELDDLPEGFTKPADRTKPWGTGQAVLCCKDLIHEPFAVINADDYYGKEPFRLLHAYLTAAENTKDGAQPICMAGFRLNHTLSENGSVTRGICRVDEQGHLTGVDETHGIMKTPEGAAVETEEGRRELDPESVVSMNMWGLQPEFIGLLEKGFVDFLNGLEEMKGKKEFLLPIFIDQLIKSGQAEVTVLPTSESWFGVTFKEDVPAVKAAFAKLTEAGIYPRDL